MNDMKATMSDRVSLVQPNAKPLSSSSAAGAYGKEQASAVGKVEGGKDLPLNVKAISAISLSLIHI